MRSSASPRFRRFRGCPSPRSYTKRKRFMRMPASGEHPFRGLVPSVSGKGRSRSLASAGTQRSPGPDGCLRRLLLLAAIPAKVALPNRQAAAPPCRLVFMPRSGRSCRPSLCPEAVLYGSPEDRPGRWQANVQCPLNPSATETPPDPPDRFATRATSRSALERNSLRREEVLASW
jgi:hypothetical protein